MVLVLNGERTARRYRLVIAQKTRLRLNAQVTTALTSHALAHHLTTSGFFPCSIDREYLFGYAADGYRSPLWLCAAYEGRPVLVHRQQAITVSFHKAVYDRRVLVLPGIHFFDAHRLQPQRGMVHELKCKMVLRELTICSGHIFRMNLLELTSTQP